MQNIKCVIFDWAGTIVDYGSLAPVMAFVNLFANRGIEVSPAIVRLGMGLDKKEHTRLILNHPEVSGQWEEKFGRTPNDADLDSVYGELEEILIEVVKDYAEPIEGAVELIDELKSLRIKVGTGTGYKANMMASLIPAAEKFGLKPDCIINSSDVPEGRPKPWMCYLNAIQLDAYPLFEMVKIGDTIADIEEGLNAGMWTIGLTRSGNEVGLSKLEQDSIPEDELNEIIDDAVERFIEAGAHYVADGVWECREILEEISDRIGKGELPW